MISIAFRLRRTITEESYVRVPVDDAVMGPHGLDTDKLMAAAVELGEQAQWTRETAQVALHPIQRAERR